MTKNRKTSKLALVAGATALAAFIPQAHADSSSDSLINKLEQKGILSADEAKQLRTEAAESETNLISQIPASKWKLSSAIKSIELFGDVRLRYEYRAADNPWPNPKEGTTLGNGNSGTTGDTYSRERFRYALRFGLRGDLQDDWNYGIRIETSSNPRSQFVTFGDDTGKTIANSANAATPPNGGTPSDKTSDFLGVGQVFLGWHPTSWFSITAGKMPQQLYTTPMVWSSSINPEGAFEKLQTTIGPVDLFAGAGQFAYQDPSVTSQFPSGDTFLLANQVGMNARFGKSMSAKIAPVMYVYAGKGNPPAPGLVPPPSQAALASSIYYPFVGQGNPSGPTAGFNSQYNQIGINDLLILEIPAEFDFKIYHTPLGTVQGRLFGDFAYNFNGDERARDAFATAPAAFPGMKSAATGENMAYQVGIGFGSDGATYGPTQGLVYGTTSKKNTWEARFYWQAIRQYSLDVNLLDADFFEGRGNLQGFYTAFSYSITDAIIGTVRYGNANPINSKLGTGGSNPDLPALNPIKNYQIVQMDLTWRF
jgi:hypothetical protein